MDKKELVTFLEPLFACDLDKGETCDCFNCIAHKALDNGSK